MLKTPYSQEMGEALMTFAKSPAAYLNDKRVQVIGKNNQPHSSELELAFGKNRAKIATTMLHDTALVSVFSPGKRDDFGMGGVDAMPYITKRRRLPGLILTDLAVRTQYEAEEGELAMSHLMESNFRFENTLIELHRALAVGDSALIEVPGLLSTRVYNPTITGLSQKSPNSTFGWNVGFQISRQPLGIKHQGRERFAFPRSIPSPEQIIDQIAQSVLHQLSLH